MAIIFSASGDTKSFQHSSRILGPLISWLFPAISEPSRDHLIFLLRKCAHLTEYAILGFLAVRGLRGGIGKSALPWSGKHARLAVLVVLIYAATDEWHQTFVPNREGAIIDVIIDTIGGTAGVILAWALDRLLKKRTRLPRRTAVSSSLR